MDQTRVHVSKDGIGLTARLSIVYLGGLKCSKSIPNQRGLKCSSCLIIVTGYFLTFYYLLIAIRSVRNAFCILDAYVNAAIYNKLGYYNPS